MRTIQSIEHILKRPYFLLFSILLFFTPLIFSQNTNELFEFPKMFFVFILSLLIILIFTLDTIIRHKKITAPNLLLVIFLFITVVSTVFSTHKYTSLLGYYSRFNDSLFSYFIYFSLCLICINRISKEDYDKLLKLILLSTIPVSLYGIAQNLSGVTRAYSTLGQPNWLAQYLGMLLPIAAYYFITEKNGSFKLWALVYIFGFYCLWVTFSTSGLLGFFAGILYLFVKKFKKISENQSYKIKILFLTFVMILVSLLNIGLYREKFHDFFIDIKKQFVVVKKTYASENSNKLSDPGFIRLELWKSTFDLITSSPKTFFFGTGPETFPYVFQAFRNGKLNYSSEWDFVFNKPHNYYLEIWSESGIFALAFFVYIVYLCIKKLPEHLASSIVVFGITNIFGWPVVPTSLIFWFVLCGLGQNDFNFKLRIPKIDFKLKSKKASFLLGALLISIISGIYFYLNFNIFKFYNADIYFKKGQEYIKDDNEEKALYYADKAVMANPYEPNYYRGRAKIKTVLLVSENDNTKIKQDIFNDLKKSLELNKSNLVTIRNSIPIYYFLAVGDVYRAPSKDNYDEKYIEYVEDYFNNIKVNYPNDVGVITGVAKYEKKLGLEESYQNSVGKIQSLRPDLLEWHELFR